MANTLDSLYFECDKNTDSPSFVNFSHVKMLKIFVSNSTHMIRYQLITSGKSTEKSEHTRNFTTKLQNTNLLQLGNFIDVFLARHVSGTYAHHQEH